MLPVDDALTGPLLNGAGSLAYSGNWTTGAVSGAYNGSVHFTTATGANAKLTNVTYNVTADVVWMATKGPDRGIATVTVEGSHKRWTCTHQRCSPPRWSLPATVRGVVPSTPCR